MFDPLGVIGFYAERVNRSQRYQCVLSSSSAHAYLVSLVGREGMVVDFNLLHSELEVLCELGKGFNLNE